MMVLIKCWALFSSIFTISECLLLDNSLWSSGRNNFCPRINTNSWEFVLVRRCTGGKRSERSPAHGYHRVQLHRREGNGSLLSSYHRLLRPLVFIAKCPFALLGVSRVPVLGRKDSSFSGEVYFHFAFLVNPSIGCQCYVWVSSF